jgi:pantetheine-phosphate adenylyltransferase
MRVGIYAGTFDPVTLGHIDIVRKAIQLVDKLIIAVADDTNKAAKFDSEKRLNFIKKSTEKISHKIEVKIFKGLLVNFVREQKTNIIIRGLRAVSDFEYEFQMSWINHKLANDIQTIFLPASKDTQFISSSFVKEVARLDGDISSFVPNEIIDDLKSSS